MKQKELFCRRFVGLCFDVKKKTTNPPSPISKELAGRLSSTPTRAWNRIIVGSDNLKDGGTNAVNGAYQASIIVRPPFLVNLLDVDYHHINTIAFFF